MPIFEYKCFKGCRKITEKFYKVGNSPEKIKCSCGKTAKKIISRGAIQCDSVNDVPWLPSACQTLQKHGEPPLQTRGEYNRYLKENKLSCVG